MRSANNKLLILLIFLPFILIISLIYGIYRLFATKNEQKQGIKQKNFAKSPNDWKSYWTLKNARKKHAQQLLKNLKPQPVSSNCETVPSRPIRTYQKPVRRSKKSFIYYLFSYPFKWLFSKFNRKETAKKANYQIKAKERKFIKQWLIGFLIIGGLIASCYLLATFWSKRTSRPNSATRKN